MLKATQLVQGTPRLAASHRTYVLERSMTGIEQQTLFRKVTAYFSRVACLFTTSRGQLLTEGRGRGDEGLSSIIIECLRRTDFASP